MGKIEKILHFETFDELYRAAMGYQHLGIECGCRSWEQIGDNVLHIFEDEEWIRRKK